MTQEQSKVRPARLGRSRDASQLHDDSAPRVERPHGRHNQPPADPTTDYGFAPEPERPVRHKAPRVKTQ